MTKKELITYIIVLSKVYKRLTRVNLFTIVVFSQITPERAFAHRVALTHDMAVDPALTPVLPARLVVVFYEPPHYLRPSFDVIVHFLFLFFKKERQASPAPPPLKTKHTNFESNSQHNAMLFYNR